MSVPEHIKRAMPFFHLGRDINDYHFTLYPDPFETKTVKDAPADILQRINKGTLKLRGAIAADPTMEAFRNLLGLEQKQFPPDEVVQTLGYLLHGEYCTIRSEQTTDSICYRMGALFVEKPGDITEGRLTARSWLAILLDRGLIVMSEQSVHPCRQIVEWVTNGNALMACNLNEQMVHAHLSKKRAGRSPSSSATSVAEFVRNLPILTPAAMDSLLADEGYVGQESARRILCLSAYRHVQRLRRILVDGVKPNTLPKRENILCIGPTGSGKSHLINVLFDKVLKIPSVIVDITKFTETGYVGEEVETILTRLLLKANGEVGIAQTGIVCIDEVDKIAGVAKSRNLYGGQGTTKDVSGLGVQRGLLKLLEASVVEVPVQLGDYRSPRVRFNTQNVLFVGCGAFSGIDGIRRTRTTVGFNTAEYIDSKLPTSDLADDLFTYGLMPEFYGRFEQFSVFGDLSREQLRRILEANTLESYRKELFMEGIGLEVAPGVIELLIDGALKRRTGARGLPAGLIGILTEAMFAAYSAEGTNRKIRLTQLGDDIAWDIHSAMKPHALRSKRKQNTAEPSVEVSSTILP